ncbi:hypothetical protein X975_00529, partial [Stegodyphus mimosarum]
MNSFEHLKTSGTISCLGLIISYLIAFVSGSPKGVAIFAGGSGNRVGVVSDQWGVLSTPTKWIVGIFSAIVVILFGIGIYRLVKWCIKSATD